MKNWLKYLLVSIVALAFYNGAGEHLVAERCSSEAIENTSGIENVYNSSVCTNLSSPDSDFCAPRPEPSVTAPRPAPNVSSSRMQSNGRRHESSSRQNFEIVKSGKTINSGIRYVLQKQSIFSHSTLIEPASRLVCLCRFII
jgi:hypothetical protein